MGGASSAFLAQVRVAAHVTAAVHVLSAHYRDLCLAEIPKRRHAKLFDRLTIRLCKGNLYHNIRYILEKFTKQKN